MTRILFVDDEISALQGFRRLLRPFAQQWTIDFATTGEEALARLAETRFDVVVADMRIRGMDGAALLERVRQAHPDTVRIVLAESVDREGILRALGAAHRCLVKPCTPGALRQAIQASARARAMLRLETVRTMVSELTCVPSLPSAYAALVREFEAPNTSLVRVAELVERDPGMTAQVLRICNSLLFGLRTEVSSAAMAVTLMGLRTVASLLLSMQVFKQFDARGLADLGFEAVCEHSLSTAWLAREIARAEGCGTMVADHAFTAALLHDVGKLLLGVNFPTLCREARIVASARLTTAAAAERAVFGADHAEVGAFLLGLWGLPQPLVDAVWLHHRPAESASPALDLATIVHVADAIDGEHRGLACSGLDHTHLATLGLEERLDAWRLLRVAPANQRVETTA